MDEGGTRVATASGVDVSPEALAIARELAEAVRAAAAADLPFEAEPAGFLAALDRLAAEEPEA